MQFVIVPGIDGSDESHWQTRWEADWGPMATRIEPSSWTEPDLDDWEKAITAAVKRSGSRPVLIAHSLGCIAAATWVTEHAESIGGVFLVAPPDRLGPSFPAELAPTFIAVANTPLAVPGLVVHSDDDPYCTARAAQRLAEAWGLPSVTVGRQGHLNSTSGLGSWETGRNLLTAFVAGLRMRSPISAVAPASHGTSPNP